MGRQSLSPVLIIAHEARDLSRQFGAVVPGFAPGDLHICSFYAPALSLDSAAATSSPLNYFSSPAQGRDQRSNPLLLLLLAPNVPNGFPVSVRFGVKWADPYR